MNRCSKPSGHITSSMERGSARSSSWSYFWPPSLLEPAYLARGSALGAILAGGVAVNSLWIVGFGFRSWRRGEMGPGLGKLFIRAYRRRISREHPTLARQTALTTVGTLIPFALTVLILIDLMRSGR